MHDCAVGDVRLLVLDNGNFPCPARCLLCIVPEPIWRKEVV